MREFRYKTSTLPRRLHQFHAREHLLWWASSDDRIWIRHWTFITLIGIYCVIFDAFVRIRLGLKSKIMHQKLLSTWLLPISFRVWHVSLLMWLGASWLFSWGWSVLFPIIVWKCPCHWSHHDVSKNLSESESNPPLDLLVTSTLSYLFW